MASRKRVAARRLDRAVSQVSPAEPQLQVGQKVAGRYRLEAPLGAGAMAQVWRVWDEFSDQALALKRLTPGPPEYAEALRGEFARLARLVHRNIVQVHDFGLDEDGTPFFTMDLVEGQPLGAAPETTDPANLMRLMEGVTEGLRVIHGAGFVHGDLKPENILVLGTKPFSIESTRIVDLGLSGPSGQGRPRGTEGFAAPEVLQGSAPSPASDLFSLGVVLYRILARMPVSERDPLADIILSREARTFSPLPLRAAGVPPELERIVMALVAREVAERPPSAATVWELMRPLARPSGRPRMRRGREALARGVLVGRAAELERLQTLLAQSGPPVLVTGTAGAGRTRFLREMSLRLEVEGGRAIVLSCAGRDDAGTELQRRARQVAGTGRTAGWEKIFEALARGGPSLVALEDLHLASEDDLAVARSLLTALRPEQVLVVLSWEENIAAPKDRFRDFLVLAHESWVGDAPPHVVLPPLSREEASELTRLLLSGTALPELETKIYEATGGQPAWVEMALADLLERGLILPEGDEWLLHAEATHRISVPEASEYVAAGVRNLSAPARRLLAALDILGGEGSVEEAARIAGTPATSREEVVSSGLAAPIGREEDLAVRAQPQFAARSAMESLDPEERTALYRRAAAMPFDDPIRNARLWLLGGEGERALEVLDALDRAGLSKSQLWRAARLRLQILRSLDRVDTSGLQAAALAAQDAHQFEEATELWREFSELSHEGQERALAFLRIAECRRWINDFEGAHQAIVNCESLLGDRVSEYSAEERKMRASVFNERAWIALMRESLEEAEVQARNSLAVSAESDLEERFTAWNRLGAILPRQGRIAEAKDAITSALRIADQLGDEIAASRAHGNAIFIARLEGDLVEERRHLEFVHGIGVRHGLRSLLTRETASLVEVLDRTGSVPDLREALAESERLAREAGDLERLASALSDSARLELRLGNLDRCRDLDRTAVLISRRSGAEHRRAWSWIRRGVLEQLDGRPERSPRYFRHALRLLRSGLGFHDRAVPLCLLGTTYLALGDHERAVRALLAAARNAEQNPRRRSMVARSVSLGAARTGNAELERAAQGLAYAGDSSELDTEVRGHQLEANAYVAILSGDRARAITLWQEASDVYRGSQRDTSLAECLADAARTLAGRTHSPGIGDHLPQEWLQEARRLYERIGAATALRAVLADLIRLLEEPGIPAGTTDSRSERDVLYQVSAILNSMLELPDLLGTSLRLVCERVRAERGLIIYVDPDSGDLTPAALFGDVSEDTRSNALQISTTIVRDVASSGTLFRSHDAPTDPRLQRHRSVFDFTLRSILCAPLRVRDEIVGTIYLQNRSQIGRFTDQDVDLLESFSNLIAIALEKHRYQEQLRRANESLILENVSLRREVKRQFGFDQLIGKSSRMREVHLLIERFAQVPTDVLIQGETGTGKEVVARIIHYNSTRREKPFMSVNCAALPATLIEAELFGIDDHVATGVRARKGIFEQTEDGTVLLDEIGDMPLDLQARLLRVLQEREFYRVGGRKPIAFRGRVVAATNADLQDRVREGRFREDLYFRVRRLVLQLPPLRDRGSDVPILARYFVEEFCTKQGRSIPALSPRLLDVLSKSRWPGNVRELENYLEGLLVVSEEPVLEPLALPSDLENAPEAAGAETASGIAPLTTLPLPDALSGMERDLIARAMRQSANNQSHAARLLGIPEPTLRYRLRKLRMGTPK